jgi:hypothetical protein
MVEAAITSEMSVNFYQTTRRDIPRDGLLHTRGRENLKSHLFMEVEAFKEAGNFSETSVTSQLRHGTVDTQLKT